MSSQRSLLVKDRFDNPVFLFENDFALRWFMDKNPAIQLRDQWKLIDLGVLKGSLHGIMGKNLVWGEFDVIADREPDSHLCRLFIVAGQWKNRNHWWYPLFSSYTFKNPSGKIIGIASADSQFLIGKECKVYPAPFHVVFDLEDEANGWENSKNVCEPDISIICDKSKLDDSGCKGSRIWLSKSFHLQQPEKIK